MDFDLRQWLLILGPVFIIGVLLHGYLRMLRSQNNIRMKLDKSFMSDPGEDTGVDDLSLLKAELPNGGARLIVPAKEKMLDLEKGVPVLMESVEVPSVKAITDTPDSHPSKKSQPEIFEPIIEDDRIITEPKAEASLVEAEDPLVEADDYYVNAEGPLTEAEGSFTDAEGSFTDAEGSLTEAEGSIEGAEGSITDAEGAR